MTNEQLIEEILPVKRDLDDNYSERLKNDIMFEWQYRHICKQSLLKAMNDGVLCRGLSVEEIANIIDTQIVKREYGEERPAKFIATAIHNAMKGES